MVMTLPMLTRIPKTELISSVVARPASESRQPQPSRSLAVAQPCGRICCGSLRTSARTGWSWNSLRAADLLSSKPAKTYNALVTGAQGELLTANTGCPSDVSDGLSSRDWESLGWPYGISYTLTASEWKEGNRIIDHRHPQVLLHSRAFATLGHVPTVCEAEFLQGFPRGSLHLWAREMQSRFRLRDGSEKRSYRRRRA